MNWPPDCVMLTLVAHAAGDKFTVRNGELHLTVQSEERTIPAPAGALDDLEARAWVKVLDSGETVITEKGLWWARRWLTKKLGAGRLKRTDGLRVTGVTGEAA